MQGVSRVLNLLLHVVRDHGCTSPFSIASNPNPAACEADVELATVPTMACLKVHGSCSIIYIYRLIQF